MWPETENKTITEDNCLLSSEAEWSCNAQYLDYKANGTFVGRDSVEQRTLAFNWKERKILACSSGNKANWAEETLCRSEKVCNVPHCTGWNWSQGSFSFCTALPSLWKCFFIKQVNIKTLKLRINKSKTIRVQNKTKMLQYVIILYLAVYANVTFPWL